MASQLAALFAFLKSGPEKLPGKEGEDLALYADPAYWLCGLLSFCAKSCEAKTTETGGEPNFKTSKERKQESTALALEPTRNSLALMQTVVMPFARGLYLGKPELPIDHVHIYFPVQIVHKVTAQCLALNFGEVTPDARKRYKHNVDNAANNPYVIVGVYEGRCTAEQYPPIPGTPTLARAYEEGILDASFGQVISFASYYQTSFRIEVPLWHKIEDGIAHPGQAHQVAALPALAREVLPDNGPSPVSSSEAVEHPEQGADQPEADADDEEAEEETYVPATGQGCYSFEMSLLQRAAQTFSKRTVADKYGQVAKWLLTGLAMAISRKNWHLLSKHRTCTTTPLLRGYVSTEHDDKKKPYAATFVQAQHEQAWEILVHRVIRRGYNAATNHFRKTREARAEIDFYRTIDQSNPGETPPEAGQEIKEQAPASSHQ